MIRIRKSNERHHEEFGWLETWWSFSFDTYHDPDHTSFGPLRVLNEDYIQPGTGFPMHAHREMEILTFVLEGALEHEDSLGNRTIIRAGEVQRMTAGKGIRHSERNPSATERLHLLQIWVLPDRPGHEPSYEQMAFPRSERMGRLLPIASGRKEAGAIYLHQDAVFSLARLEPAQRLTPELAEGRRVYLQMIAGSASLSGITLRPGDAAKIQGERDLAITAIDTADLLWIDLP
jgi:redox-sensitive bicupin YhaK (pirin superfamily)